MKNVLILIALLFCTTTVVHADNDHECQGNPHHCGGDTGPPGADGADGADGQDGQDGEDGADGTNGIDGVDGQDGQDGRDGIDGLNGIAGINGRDGIDGVVDTKWITETRNWQSKYYNFAAADNAIQVYLPQDQTSRVTFGVAQVHGTTGYAVGYAYKTDRKDALAFTLGLGTSGGEQVGKASVGFEFGGSSKPSHRHETSCSYVGGELNMEKGADQECE